MKQLLPNFFGDHVEFYADGTGRCVEYINGKPFKPTYPESRDARGFWVGYPPWWVMDERRSSRIASVSQFQR